MKVTSTLSILLLLIFVSGCDNDDNRAFENDSGRFVRFFLQLDRNGEPLVSPDIELGSTAVSVYNKDNFKTLKIPVALTSTPLDKLVTVDFTAEFSGGLNNVTIEPAGQLSFQGSQLVDTLRIKVNERWDATTNPSLKLTLTDSSDNDIRLGMNNNEMPLNELIINFEEVQTTYGIEPPSRVDVVGSAGEDYVVNILFPQGFIENEIDLNELLSVTQSNFLFNLDILPIVSDELLSFQFEIENEFDEESLFYKTSLALSDLTNYSLDGFPLVSFVRQPLTPRDLAVNTAANFYDTSNSFYRLYGVNWMDFNEDGICEWRDFNTFTIPVEVPENDPNAVLGNDMGTPDPSDDVYYHAFRIGFSPPTNTTNSFNLRRWFTNESTSEENSPGFNINPALEFFPDDGSSATSGTVQVVEQTIQIGTTEANGGIRRFIVISGSGNYTEIAPGVFDIELTLNATNNQLFGGTRSAKYHIYNTNSFTDPVDLTEDCFRPIPIQ